MATGADDCGSSADLLAAEKHPRYYLLPRQPDWQFPLFQLDIGATACAPSVDWWNGGLPVPKPPHDNCWLLATTEPMAISIAM